MKSKNSNVIGNNKNIILNKITNLIHEYFKENEIEFIPGKTKIKVAEPTYNSEEVANILECLLSTYVTMGKKVERFEEEFSNYVNVKHSVMVNSGSSANLLAMKILANQFLKGSAKRNLEVITPATTWSTTVFPIVDAGFTPVFVDVNMGTYDISVDECGKALNNHASGIVVVHLLGNPCDMYKIQKMCSDIFILEDCCEAIGSEIEGVKVGSFGDVGTYSFYFSHHISTIEGGILVTNKLDIAESARSMRSFGWTRDVKALNSKVSKDISTAFQFENMGYNMRPMDIQAAMGSVQIKKLKNFLKIRKNNAEYWNKRFKKYDDLFFLPKQRPGTKNSWFCYPLTIKPEAPFDRNHITQFLEKKGIETRPIMAGNMVEQPVMRTIRYKITGNLSNSRLIMRNGFFFGDHHKIGSLEREYIADSIDEFISINVKN